MPISALPYRDAFGSGARPYLALHVTGINGRSGPIVGLIDSGADRTSLPMGYARLMGYDAADIDQAHCGVADGSTVSVWNATKPASAYVIGMPGKTFDLFPTFVPGTNASTLWGRLDFFMAFRIGFDEPGQHFSLEY